VTTVFVIVAEVVPYKPYAMPLAKNDDVLEEYAQERERRRNRLISQVDEFCDDGQSRLADLSLTTAIICEMLDYGIVKLKKRRIIGSGWWSAVFISLAIVSACAGSEPSSDTAAESDAGSDEVLIRNATNAPVEYLVKASDKDEEVKKSLPARSMDRYPAGVTLHVTFESDGKQLAYQLDPGRRYAFRNDYLGNLGLYVGAHTREDAPDLAPYVPTPHAVVETMFELAELSEDDLIIDLGCGDGRIVVAAARDYGARGIGIDIDPELIEKAKRLAKSSGVDHLVEFRVEDATQTSLATATVVSLFLTPGGNELIRPRLETGLRPGARVITHNYTIPGWMVMGVETLGDERERHDLYLYVIGKR
jgi:ribosomal protein L11 methylase PrmA